MTHTLSLSFSLDGLFLQVVLAFASAPTNTCLLSRSVESLDIYCILEREAIP
jgi:hypothetical protein